MHVVQILLELEGSLQQVLGSGDVIADLGEAWDPEFPVLFLLESFHAEESDSQDDDPEDDA